MKAGAFPGGFGAPAGETSAAKDWRYFFLAMAPIDSEFPAQSEPRAVTRRGVRLRAALMGLTLCAGAVGAYAITSLEAVAQDAKKSIKTMDGKEVDIEEARKLFEEHQRKLKEAQQEQKSLEVENKTLDAERTAIQASLLQVAQKAQETDKRLNKIEADLAVLSQREGGLRKDLDDSRATIAQMLGVMQRMGREPPPVMITERHDALKMVRSAMILSSFFPGFKEKADKLATQVVELNEIITKSQDERQRFADAQARANQTKAELDTLLAQKREKMQKAIARLEDVRSAASKHSRAVTDLGGLLQRLDGDATKIANIAEYEKELKQLDSDHVLKPEAKQVAFVQPGRMKPAIPFDKAKGMLPMPCQGKRLIAFGGHDDSGVKSEGIRVESRPDSQVIAPSDGWVIYAGHFRTYGQLLIINAGGGYHILLAGMDQIYTTVGQFVLAGEPVASMGKSSVPAGSSEIRKPVLYIEFRKDARPVDPDPWWSAEGVKEG